MSFLDGPPPTEEEARKAYEAFGLKYQPVKAKLTQDEHDYLFEATNQFWVDFSKLVEDTLRRCPEDIRPHLKYLMQEKTSVYGAQSEF